MIMARRLGPSDRDLERYLQKGMSYQEIADMYGVRRNTVASIAHRAGLSKARLKYRTTELWQPVKDEHSDKHELNMLRALEQQLKGEDLDLWTRGRLTSFMDKLETVNGVVAYAPDLDAGFFVLDRAEVPAEWLDKELPIVTRRFDRILLMEFAMRWGQGLKIRDDTQDDREYGHA